ncbi:MAG: hypothetical protein C0606_04140 [Hyphomicrobiales bacterium]|nr:MAG: hypothetical protein C0606_04140 [Hyphomicrobiales bacterium]
MDPSDLIERLAIALAIGLIVGLERGWKERNEEEGRRFAGIRTFALSALLGGFWGALVAVGGAAAYWALGLAFASFCAVIALLHRDEVARDRDIGSTTVVAAMLTFALGAFAVLGDRTVAAAGGVAVALLLAAKGAMHAWLRRLSWEELRATLMLAAMTLILLPLLPDRDMGPFDAVNPRQIWLMMIIIAAVSFLGYGAIKLSGERRGTLLSAVAGGLVSSTIVTIHMSRLARKYPQRWRLFAGGAVLACATMTARIVVVAAFFNIALLRWLLPPMAIAGLLMLVLAWILLRARDGDPSHRLPLVLKNPFELGAVLTFGLILAAALIVSKGLTILAGDSGAYAMGAAAGFADVDTVTLSMARLSQGALAADVAATAILIAALSNTLAKTVLAWLAGGWRVGSAMLVGLVLTTVGIIYGMRIAQQWDPVAFLSGLQALAS